MNLESRPASEDIAHRLEDALLEATTLAHKLSRDPSEARLEEVWRALTDATQHFARLEREISRG